jgi:hypothetical protein
MATSVSSTAEDADVSTEDVPSLDYQIYINERKILVDADREAARTFDKAMVTLSGGALALSIGFIDKIAPEPQHERFLIAGWAGFIAALLCTLFSLLTSQHAMKRQIAICESVFMDDGSGAASNGWAIATLILNIAAIVIFVVGVAMLVTFSSMNVLEAEK